MAHQHVPRNEAGWSYQDEEYRKSVHDLKVARKKGATYAIMAVLAVLGIIGVTAYLALTDIPNVPPHEIPAEPVR
jgi:NADPH-dependent curcumin reductase CurA